MPILGQDKLLAKLDSYNIMSMPKTLMICGEDSLTRANIVTRLADKLGLDLVDVGSNITPEQIMDYMRYPVKTMYRIKISAVDEKAQNKFLKFIEEPSETVYIVIEADSEIGILPTILNRCVKLYMSQYTPAQLKEYFGWTVSGNCDERIFEICTTPEQLQNLPSNSFADLYVNCEDIVYNIKSMSFTNIYKLIQKVNCKENYCLCELPIFFAIMQKVSLEAMKKDSEKAFDIYKLTAKYRQQLAMKNIMKDHLLIDYLTELYKETR